MAKTLYISIPCQYKDNELTVKALDFKSNGKTAKEALTEITKNSIYYVSFVPAEVITWIDFKGIEHNHIEVPFDSIILDKINKVEPYPNDVKKTKNKGLLSEPSAEEILKLGF